MLQAHSLLWHYLWVAPNVFLVVLAFLLYRHRIYERYPFFLAFAVVTGLEQLTVYAADVIPSVTPETWWRLFWAGLLIEGLLKFALVGEIFGNVFNAYASVAKLGKFLIRGVGILLVLGAALAAAYAPKNSPFGIISGAHVLEQTIYLIEAGLLLFIFLFSGYFRVRPSRPAFGIAVGLAISACVHLGTWAILANGVFPDSTRSVLDFLNMATYHVAVLIWFYYLLVPERVDTKSAVLLPENNLAVWNRELERLLQQ
jgi:hypothetical protein